MFSAVSLVHRRCSINTFVDSIKASENKPIHPSINELMVLEHTCRPHFSLVSPEEIPEGDGCSRCLLGRIIKFVDTQGPASQLIAPGESQARLISNYKALIPH